MGFFTEEDVSRIQNLRSTIRGRYESLMIHYTQAPFAHPKARELADQGFSRRLQTLVRCVDNVFRIIPPTTTEIRPSADSRRDCAINLQAFISNVFGCMDNLALVWVHERGIRRPNGKEIGPLRIGLGAKSEDVRNSLSEEFRTYLEGEGMVKWFTYLEGYRHALAHRVPLYVPGAKLNVAESKRYRALKKQIDEAAQRHDFDEHDRRNEEQDLLGTFVPVMKHSYEEDSPEVPFHEQILMDFLNIDELGKRMVKELKRPDRKRPARL